MNAMIIGGNAEAQKWVMQANVPFHNLRKKAQFTYMRDPGEDLYTDNEPLPKNEAYQRRIKDDRIKDIKKFIRDAILNEYKGEQVSVLFPTAMLLASRIERSFTLFETINLQQIYGEFGDFYVVDGQHRLKAMEELYDEVTNRLIHDENDEVIKEYLDRYFFNCTILLNFDLWEQAQVFADVNFNQAKVNKSLYYSIYGMNYSKNPSDWNRNYIFIAHSLVKFINNFETSPLKGSIKMLGTGKGFISQAFLGEALMPHIRSPRGIWYVDPHILTEKPNYRFMAVELLSYFAAVKAVLIDYWPKNNIHQSILCKTTGIGAMIRLMAFLHQTKMPQELKEDLLKTDKTAVHPQYTEFVMPLLMKLLPEAKDLFSLKGIYAGTGGKGLEHQLFVALQYQINKD
jgi:DGQHR domain-containing protein